MRPFGECERQLSGAVVDGGEGTPPQHDGGSLLPQRLPLVGTRCPLLSPHLAVLRTVKYMKKLVHIGNRCSISNFIFLAYSQKKSNELHFLIFGLQQRECLKACVSATVEAVARWTLVSQRSAYA